MASSPAQTLTIGRLARAASVGVETVRYYQKRGLLPVPKSISTFRQYPVELIDRIRFVKRAQELGFSLEEIGDLLLLEDGRDRARIRGIAADRLEQIGAKLTDLRRMQAALKRLIVQCEHTKDAMPCPIITSLSPSTGRGRAHDGGESSGD